MMHVDSSPIPTASESRARKLHGALQQVLSNQQWPSRVRVFELALAFGTSEPKLRRLIAVEPAFKEEIARINNDYRAERIRWKFSLLASEQRSLYITVFLKEISLMGTSSNINTVLKVADEQPNWPVLVHGRRNPF